MAEKTVQAPMPRQAPGFFNSPKNQKRILIGSVLIFVIGAAAFISLVVFRGTGNAFTSPISTNPAQLIKPEKKVPVSPQALATARKFIETAVLRQNVDAAWPLVHVDLRGRMTRKSWDTGNIPVIDYPANNAKDAQFVVDYSYQTSMLAEVDLVAKKGSGVRPHLDFYIGLKKKDGKWLVSYWEPHWRPPVPLAPN
ncbi:MAG TPA: hypothetical protein VGU02_06465 [Gaiellaceae bacterium]|nr:hypothetical protein [Gaiellaceae bacterium]